PTADTEADDEPLTFLAEAPEEGAPAKAPQTEPEVKAPEPTRLGPVQERLLQLDEVIRRVGDEVSRHGDEICYFFTKGGKRIALRCGVHDGRWAYLERRLRLDPQTLQGKPTGRLSLLYALNAINSAALGLRCILDDDRLRIRRSIYLPQHLGDATLRVACTRLLRESDRALQALSSVRRGTPWPIPTEDLRSEPTPAEELSDVAGELKAAGSVVREVDHSVLSGLGPEAVRFTWEGGELQASHAVHAWKAPTAWNHALLSEPSPAAEALVEDLNQRNRTGAYALSWVPEGVQASIALSPHQCDRAALLAAIYVLRKASSLESFPSLRKE
ncbi:MAG: hypothetical protein JKY65_05405, partial [Planctomycetes bacterium]|nr:hypothetical protein [Planctomycetota bacterium]